MAKPPVPRLSTIVASRGIQMPKAMKTLDNKDMEPGRIVSPQPGGVTHNIRPEGGGPLVTFSNRHVTGGGRITHGARCLFHRRVDDSSRADVVVIL